MHTFIEHVFQTKGQEYLIATAFLAFFAVFILLFPKTGEKKDEH